MKLELLKKIEQEQSKILDYLTSSPIDEDKGLGMYTGVSGEILFLAQAYSINKDKKIENKINSLLDYGIDCIQTGKFLYPTFSSGLSGFAWIVDYLLKDKIIDQDSETILDILELNLYKDMLSLLRENNFDLLNGAMGIVVHFLKRNKFDYVEEIINYLYENKINHNDEFIWIIDKRNQTQKTVIDFSLAHGMAGILFILTRCYSEKIQTKKCEEMINGILRFYHNNEQDFHAIGSFYPNTIESEIFLSNKENGNVKSRLAWCYGDLGILSTVRNTYEVLNDKRSVVVTTRKLLLISERISNCSVIDAGFCHGSSGNAFLFNNLYMQTGNKKFQKASLHWLEQTTNFNKVDKNKDLNYILSSSIFPERRSFDGLLEGLSGVGLVYNTFLNKNLPYCNDAFMLI